MDKNNLDFRTFFRASNPKWFSATTIDKADKKVLTIDLLEPLDSWFGVDPSELVKSIQRSVVDEIEIFINSPGGNTFGSFAIYNALRQHGARIKTHNLALAASAASLIFLAGDDRYMYEGALMMIHRASTFAAGNSKEMAKIAETLSIIDTQQIKYYSKIFKESEQEVESYLDAETWFDGDKLESMGVATIKTNPVKEKVATLNTFNLGAFKNPPESLLKKQEKVHNESMKIKAAMKERMEMCNLP